MSSLLDYDLFCSDPAVVDLLAEYRRGAKDADLATDRVVADLNDINETYFRANGRAALTSIEGRFKKQTSFFTKLHKLYCEQSTAVLSNGLLQQLYMSILDLCGARFACPYLDEIQTTIDELVRPHLNGLGYTADLRSIRGREDENRLIQRTDGGYRAYHFFVTVPITRNGRKKQVLCEVQARSELQHVWAVKSHSLLYHPTQGGAPADPHVGSDMRKIGDLLHTADELLVTIRERVRRGAR